MQERHTNRNLYFRELSTTSKNYYLPYIKRFHRIEIATNILEIGCGEGGNLLPFSQMGCMTTGVDIAVSRIEEAKHFFCKHQAKGNFIAKDIFNLKNVEPKYDIIICHDVIEHIEDKILLLSRIENFLKTDGIVFMSFPAWQMPFGGHQQICKNRILSHLPYIHLLPTSLYKVMMRLIKENEACIKELLSIKHTKITIEMFEQILERTDLTIRDRQLWLINPHYEVKFGWHPCKLPYIFSNVPYIRNFFCSSCFYILSHR